jgi:hypothetical protein
VKWDDPTPKASILYLKSDSQDARNQFVVCASGSLKGVKASGLAKACEATHEYIDSPWSFTEGRTTKAKHRFR